MARSKAFDHDGVVQSAMEAFWSYGYGPTSVQDLVEHTGINRGSLYDTFGSKHDLWFRQVNLNSVRPSYDGPLRSLLS